MTTDAASRATHRVVTRHRGVPLAVAVAGVTSVRYEPETDLLCLYVGRQGPILWLTRARGFWRLVTVLRRESS